MTNRRRSTQQAAAGMRRRLPGGSIFVPRSVAATAGRSVATGVARIRPTLLRNIDLHPALVMLTGVAIVALVCVFYLRQVTAVTNANYTFLALQREYIELQQEREDLQLEIGKAQSLSNIADMARKNLQMVPIGDKYQYITITGGPITAMPPLPTPILPVEAP
jgi:cell division protein FtsB